MLGRFRTPAPNTRTGRGPHFRRRVFGKGVLPADQSMPPGDFVGRLHTAGEPPNVVISGWRIYDNKGHVVEEFEPFFSVGWEYRSPV